MKIIDYPDRDMLAIDLANRLAGELKNCLLTHDHASFAVPGGTTPGPIFDALCAADLDWERVHIFPTDERCVAADDPRSNAGLIRERLMTGHASAARFLPLYVPADTPEEGVITLNAQLETELPISVLVLGMGADMHTASLFPGAAGLTAALDAHAPIATVIRSDSVPEPRISLTARVLDGALSKHVVIFGSDKRAALERALTLPPEDAPIQAILTETTVHWAE